MEGAQAGARTWEQGAWSGGRRSLFRYLLTLGYVCVPRFPLPLKGAVMLGRGRGAAGSVGVLMTVDYIRANCHCRWLRSPGARPWEYSMVRTMGAGTRSGSAWVFVMPGWVRGGGAPTLPQHHPHPLASSEVPVAILAPSR